MKLKKVRLDIYELKIIINSLNEMRNSLIEHKKETNIIDELLLKYINILENWILSNWLWIVSSFFMPEMEYIAILILRWLNLKERRKRYARK